MPGELGDLNTTESAMSPDAKSQSPPEADDVRDLLDVYQAHGSYARENRRGIASFRRWSPAAGRLTSAQSVTSMATPSTKC